MDATDLHSLNDRFAIPGVLALVEGQGGLITVEISNALAKGGMTLAGGHITSYHVHGQPDIFWMSPNSAHQIGKAMRGGIPICWPWFAAHPTEPQSKPMHGFARTALWSLVSTRALPDGSTEVQMGLNDSAETRVLWPHAFELRLTATFGATLSVSLAVRNTGTQPFQYTGAMHHYFNVSDVRAITIHGLDGVDYLDKIEDFTRKHQEGDLRIPQWTDRIYINTTSECVIEDPSFRRQIHIAKEGSRTTVVWNPMEKAALMPDVGEGNQIHFVCVETANADQDRITVPPGAETKLVAHISAQ